MEISIDMQADAMYIKLKNGKFAKNKIIDEDTILDLDKSGNILGIELLSISKRIPVEQLSKFNISVPIRKK